MMTAAASVNATAPSKEGAKKPTGEVANANMEIGLKGAIEGRVVTRFPPEPSGYLHIGHAKAALLNDYFARAYKGKLILRFDDTNPSKEKLEFEQSIIKDLELLGIKPDITTHTSDHFEKIYQLALQMIREGKAFVDDTEQEQMRAERFDGIDSKNRHLSVAENLSKFQEMSDGTEYGLKCCLRAKMNMQDKNKAMRDPVIYRCNLTPHHYTGTKYKVYPTYDFACPIVDSLEGVTHALRTNEYRDRNPQYAWMLKALNLPHAEIWDFSRLNFVYTLLSKRKLTWFVEQKLVSGWDDPRFPTVRGIRRRGMTVEALRRFILSQGASQNVMMLEWDKIWSMNKKVIDGIVPRHTCLELDKIVKVKVVDDALVPYSKTSPKHKKNPDVGTKTVVYSTELYLEFADAKDLVVGEEVTFMDWGNMIVKSIAWNADHSALDLVEVTLNLEGDFKKTKKKLTWLSRSVHDEGQTVPLVLYDYDYLINKKKLEEDDDVAQFVTPKSEFTTLAVGDLNVRSIKKGDMLQFERKGYYVCDKAWESDGASPPHFIAIPDGRSATMASKADVATPPVPKKETKAKKDKKEKKEKSGQVGGAGAINMYPVSSLYGNMSIDVSKVSGMYAVDSIYGEEATKAAASLGNVFESKTLTKKPESVEAAPPKAAADADAPSLVHKLDIVVGKIIDVKKHPDADSLYIEQIDVGEATPREIVSGLVKYMTPDQILGKFVLVLKNLKPVAMRGVKSYGMVLCASNEKHGLVEFLVPPPGSQPGDKVFFKGHEGEPDAQLNPKKKVWESIQPDFTSRPDDLVAVWKGVPFETSRGFVKAASLAKAVIR